MTAMVVFTKNKSAAIYVKTAPNDKVVFEVSVQNLLDPGKADRACAVLSRDELIEIRDAITALLDT